MGVRDASVSRSRVIRRSIPLRPAWPFAASGRAGRGDAAILCASGVPLTPLGWADTPGVGETVAFAGYPHGFGTDAATSRGIVSWFYTNEACSF